MGIRVKVSIPDSTIRKLIYSNAKIKNLMKLAQSNIETGFFDDVQHPASEGTKRFSINFNLNPAAQISVAKLVNLLDKGFYNKFAHKYISPRPFFTDSQKIILYNLKNIINNSIETNNPVEEISSYMENIIKATMKSGNYSQNTALTLQFKKGTQPLFDSDFLYNSVETRMEAK